MSVENVHSAQSSLLRCHILSIFSQPLAAAFGVRSFSSTAFFDVWPVVADYRNVSEHGCNCECYTPTNALSFETHFRVPVCFAFALLFRFAENSSYDQPV